jgi:hypothetical protein
MRTFAMAMAVVLGLATIGRAAPLDLKQVPAEAKWVMHVDVDAFRASVVVDKAYHKCLEMHKDAAKKMDMVAAIIGMDPRKDIHGFTVYGKDTNKEHGVLIVHADVNQNLLLTMVAMAPDHKATTYGAYELHSWTHKHGKKKPCAVTGVFYKPNIMVFAGCVDGVKAALDVLDGKASGITGHDSPLAGRTLPGTIFLARASAIDPKEKCPVLKQTDSFRVALGEYNGHSFYRARLVMKSTTAVDQLKAISEGFRALVSLAHGSDPLAMKLISGLKVSGEGTTFNVRWTASADDVWSTIEKAANQWVKHHKEWMEHHKGGRMHGPPICTCPTGSCPLHGDAHKAKPKPHNDDEF